MASSYWIKLYHETLHDPKVMRLSDRLFRRWIEVLLLAGESNQDGVLPSVGDMAWTLRVSQEDLEQDLRGLETAHLIQEESDRWIVTRFAVRQAAVPGRERVERFRERQHKAEALGNAPVTNRYTDTDTDTEADVDAEAPAQVPVTRATPETAAAAANSLGMLLETHGIRVSSPVQVDIWRDLYQDAGPALFQKALREAVETAQGIPKPKYVRSIIDRCRKEGLAPGQWRDPPDRASPSRAATPPHVDPPAFRNPLSGKVEQL